MHQLPDSGEWILVRVDALPEVYHKVLMVDEALASGRCSSVSEAVRAVGLSRSAYYKYKDCVAPYVGKGAAAYTVVDLVLQDSPGVLSGLLSAFAAAGANIATVNQRSPAGGRAYVSICAKTDRMLLPMDSFAAELSNIPGVQRISAIRRTAAPEEKGGEVS